MTHVALSRHPLGVVLRIVVVAAAAIGVVVLATDSVIGWFVPLAVVGGGVMAAAMLLTRTRDRHTAFSPDNFARGGMSGDVLNVSRVRVAGFGGALLVLFAMIVAFQYQLTTFAWLAGAAGGALGALAVILHRRQHQP